MRDLRNTIAAAIHDGPSAVLELDEVGMPAHSWEECPHKPTYLGDADALMASGDLVVALSSPPADDVREALARIIGGTPDPWLTDYEAADALLSDPRFEVRLRGTVTDAEVEAAARAMFEDTVIPGDGYTWAEMVAEDPRRADIWRADARRVLKAAGEARP